jgi:hypothetical protein
MVYRFLLMLAVAAVAGCRSAPERLYEPGQTQNRPRAETAATMDPGQVKPLMAKVAARYPAVTADLVAPLLEGLTKLEQHQAKAWDYAIEEDGKPQILTVRIAKHEPARVEVMFISTSSTAVEAIKGMMP